MATVNELTDAAYIKCGIRSPDATDDAEALLAINNMIGSWSADIIIPVFIQNEYTLTVGKAEYTIGSGSDFDQVRPVNITNAYLKDSDEYSYPLKIISVHDYNKIGQKTLSGRPVSLFYYPTYPEAQIVFNKKADKAYTACFEFIHHLTEFAAITTTVSLPNEYKEALIYNLAIRLAENNSIELSPSVFTLAQAAYFNLSRITAINRMPPMARFDFGTGAPSNITTGE